MLSKYPIRNSSTGYRVINETALIVGGIDGNLRTLNSVGTLIWTLADGKHTVSDIIIQVCRDFEVEDSQAALDTETFIKELEKKNMLQLINTAV